MRLNSRNPVRQGPICRREVLCKLVCRETSHFKSASFVLSTDGFPLTYSDVPLAVAGGKIVYFSRIGSPAKRIMARAISMAPIFTVRGAADSFQALETCVAKVMQVRENVPRFGKRREELCGENAVKSFYIEITKETKKGATPME